MTSDRYPGDGYARLNAATAKWFKGPSLGGALAFVDVDSDDAGWTTIRSWLRALPPSLLAGVSTLLMRIPADVEKQPEEIKEHLWNRGFDVPTVGVVSFEVGCPPSVAWTGNKVESNEVLLQRARRVELESLLRWGEAIWEPRSYHYRLPSGNHSRSFVRLADAFRDPRAAGAMATWLYAAIGQGTILVVDSGSLGPLVTELRAVARQAIKPIYQVFSLDEYPVSKYEYRSAFRDSEPGVIVGLVSVSSTGRTVSRLQQVLSETVDDDSWRLERVVSLSAQEGEATGVPSSDAHGSQAPWMNLGHLEPPSSPGECSLCKDPELARVVFVHPHNYAAMSLPEPMRLMPQLDDARHNSSIWDWYDDVCSRGDESASMAVPLLGAPRKRVDGRNELAGTFFEVATLAATDTFRQKVSRRLAELASWPERRAPAVRRSLERLKGFDLIVIDSDDVEALVRAHRLMNPIRKHDKTAVAEKFASDIGHALGGSTEFAVVDQRDQSRIKTLSAVVADKTYKSVLIATLGLRTGATLEGLLVDIRDAFRAYDSVAVKGLAVHAHPDTSRSWTGMRNAFRAGPDVPPILALWLTYYPPRSPLLEERELLKSIPDSVITGLGADGRRILATRRDQDWIGPFWTTSNARLRRSSHFGEQLGARVVIAAVGSAMQRRRLEAKPEGVPHWAQFDMPHIFRSYFDGLIHAAVLRWLEPHEGWWGEENRGCEPILLEIEQRSTDDWRLILPELLLAAAQGKLPVRGMELVANSAETLLSSSLVDGDERGFIELGLAIVQDALD